MDQSLSGGFSRRPRVCLIGLFSIAESYLVDPASNQMLVSEINPCMSKFTLLHGETANSSLNHSRFLTMPRSYFENCGNSRAKISLPHPGKAAGAQRTHSRHGEVMTKRNNTGLFPRPFDWNK